MKLFSTTFDDKERTKEINDLVGKPISLLKAIKMGGKGSSRMFLDEVSPSFEHMMNRISNVNYSSLEIRPRGIIVHVVQSGLKSWNWVIPFQELKIDEKNGLIISAGEEFVKYRKDRHLVKNARFVENIKQVQRNYLGGLK